MKRKIALLLIALVVLNGCVAAYGFFGNVLGINTGKPPVIENDVNDEVKLDINDAEDNNEFNSGMSPEDVVVSSKVVDKLRKASRNSKIVENYKVLVAENEMSDEAQEKLDSLIVESDKPPLTLAFYDFFNDRFFTYDDLKTAEERYKSGEDEAAILADYIAIERQFSLTDFASGKLETLINSGISANSIIIADVLHQRDVLDFDYIMDLLLSGKSWEDIGGEVGLINTTGSVTEMIITDKEIESCSEGTDNLKDEVIGKIVEAKRMELSDDAIVKYVQSNKSFEDALVEYYEKRY